MSLSSPETPTGNVQGQRDSSLFRSIIDEPQLQLKMPYARDTAPSSSMSIVQQEWTEQECEPYFVDLTALPKSQLDHLRESGILYSRQNDPNNQDSVTGNDEDCPLEIMLLREKHVAYLQQLWWMGDSTNLPPRPLKAGFISLDASRTWMLYWTLHACDLLDHQPSLSECHAIFSTIQSCFWTQNIVVPSSQTTVTIGGFGGGPQQLPHAATTYAAVNTLVLLTSMTKEQQHDSSLYSEIVQYLRDTIRGPLKNWILYQLYNPRDSCADHVAGSFRMHHDGEIDIRASYCILAVTTLLNIDLTAMGNESAGEDKSVGIVLPDALQFVANCQTYEGGFGGEPFAEAHGGYTFCATAAAWLLQDMLEQRKSTFQTPIDWEALTGWLVRRQMSCEGGFNGRANKLVDGCYSFWQGGAMAIVAAQEQRTRLGQTTSTGYDESGDPWLQENTSSSAYNLGVLFDRPMLERYILLCSQDINGGLRDKPSKTRDFYHSCYTLSGLSVAQYCQSPDDRGDFGHTSTRVAMTHPVFNLRCERVRNILWELA